MKHFFSNPLALLFLILFSILNTISFYSQDNETIKNTFLSKKGFEKIVFYEVLDGNLKKSNRDFFLLNLKKLGQDNFLFKNKNEEVRYKFSLAEIYSINDGHLKSIEILKEILNDKEHALSNEEHMKALVGLQESYLSLNLFSNVFKINSEIALLKKKGAQFPIWNYNIKSKLYAQLYLFDKAIPQLKFEIMELYKIKNRDSLIIASAYNDLGFYYSILNKNDSALFYYNLSLKKAYHSLKDNNYDSYSRLKALVNGNIAILKIRDKEYSEAIPLLEEDAQLGIKNNDDINGTCRSLISLAECYIKTKNFTSTKNTVKLLEQYISKGVHPDIKVNFYIIKAEYYKEINQNEKAIVLYQNALQLSESLNTEMQKTLLAGNEILYQLEEKDNLINKQQADIDKTQKRILFIIAFALVIFLITTQIYLYNSRKKRKEIEIKNDEISTKNTTIRESLNEKEILLKEIHHRVKNNLQVISGILELQNLNIEDEKAKSILKEGQSRIQSIALVHKTLYQSDNFSKVQFENYMKELIDSIQNTFRNDSKKIEIQVSKNNVEIGINTAIPLSLIINEIITNCFKHAFIGLQNGLIKIDLVKKNDIFELVVQDNGIGFAEDFDHLKLNSIGLDLIQGLTKQLDGTFKIENNSGTKITILFREQKA